MQVSIASEPIKAGSPNLDWAGATDHVAVVLDGLTEGAATGCVHGTAWYVHQLGARLLLHAGARDASPLAASLSHAISEVAELHRNTCDLSHQGSPCATVTMVRQRERQLEYLVLSDSPLVIDLADGPMVVIDESEKVFSARLREQPGDLMQRIHHQQLHRNTSEGYWIAQHDPAAANYAITGTVDDARGALLTSDGAALLVTDYHELTWEQLLHLGYTEGPTGIIGATRKAEASDPDRVKWPRYKVSDDATAVLCRP